MLRILFSATALLFACANNCVLLLSLRKGCCAINPKGLAAANNICLRQINPKGVTPKGLRAVTFSAAGYIHCCSCRGPLLGGRAPAEGSPSGNVLPWENATNRYYFSFQRVLPLEMKIMPFNGLSPS